MTTNFSKKIKKRYRKIGNRFDFGNGIRSLNNLAGEMGVDVGYLSRIFNGKCDCPDWLPKLICEATNAPQSVHDELQLALLEDYAAQNGIDLDSIFAKQK